MPLPRPRRPARPAPRPLAPGAAALAGVLLALAAGAASAPAGAQPGRPVPALRDYRWTKRVLAVFAPPAGAPAESTYRAQRDEFARYAAALGERDLVVLDHPAGAAPGRVRALRQQLGVPGEGFAVVLVGKDGTVKLRRRALLTAERVLATVDGMPMGAAEARARRRRAGG
jgi:hypothetical protein